MVLDQSPEPNNTNALTAQEGINAHFWDRTVGQVSAHTTVVLSAREVVSKGKPSKEECSLGRHRHQKPSIFLKIGLTSELNTSEKTVLYLKRSGPVQRVGQNSSQLEKSSPPLPSAPLLADSLCSCMPAAPPLFSFS